MQPNQEDTELLEVVEVEMNFWLPTPRPALGCQGRKTVPREFLWLLSVCYLQRTIQNGGPLLSTFCQKYLKEINLKWFNLVRGIYWLMWLWSLGSRMAVSRVPRMVSGTNISVAVTLRQLLPSKCGLQHLQAFFPPAPQPHWKANFFSTRSCKSPSTSFHWPEVTWLSMSQSLKPGWVPHTNWSSMGHSPTVGARK